MASRWTTIALAATLLAVEAVVLAESWRGLVGFADLIGITGAPAWGVPVTLDGVSLLAALVALRAELAGEASGVYRVTMFAFTGGSAAANYWHGRTVGGIAAAVYLGGMSIAVAVVFSLALRQIRYQDRRGAGTVTDRLPRFSAAHWVRYPQLTWWAWSLAVRDGHTTARQALAAAAEQLVAHSTVALSHDRSRRAAARPDATSHCDRNPQMIDQRTATTVTLSHDHARDVALVATPSTDEASDSDTLSHDCRPDVACDRRPTQDHRGGAGGDQGAVNDVASLSQADAIRCAIERVGAEPARVVAWLADRGRPGVAPQRVSDIVRRDRRGNKQARTLRVIDRSGVRS